MTNNQFTFIMRIMQRAHLQAYSALFLLLAWISPVSAASFEIFKTELPLGSSFNHENLSLEKYFEERDLAHFSLGEDHRSGNPVIFRDTQDIVFNEMLLFRLEKNELLGTGGRKKLIEEFFRAYQNSLRNNFGACSLVLQDEGKLLAMDSFQESERIYLNQPGTRLRISNEDLIQPSWYLLCKDASGVAVEEKSGNSIFIYIEFFENTSPSELNGHFAEYYISLR